ncbi:hypothetical protein LOTGIDRAFT_172846 [Lottia gigantea]|uniref:SEFIR domain-containing protein n=1 Tax=Lottia gigantea TaxID=225164 RepID=V4B129_LOTGI|nr:hypothetical protein LOTGIDRAFT_172846 [Lottia gigantea]ESP01006.1 hypothetical protein LOTGIDRAFT_172846 [Lottia gigantea]
MVSGEEEEEYKWTPTITVSDIKLSGLRVNFDPPYPGAVWHHICAQFPDNYFMCVKRIFKVKMPLASKFIEIPNNKTYRIMVRPYDNYTKPLYKFIPASSYIFLPPFDTELTTIDIPVESPVQNVTEKTPGDASELSQPINIAVVVILCCLAALIVLTLIGILIYKRKKKEKQFVYNLGDVDYPDIPSTIRESRGPVTITPLYLHDSTGMVEAHLDILRNQPNISLDMINVKEIHGNIAEWINTKIKSLSENTDLDVLIYASKTLTTAFTNPDTFHESLADQICVKVIEKLCQNPNIVPYIVCFGEQEDLKNYPPLVQYPSVISVIKYKADNSVSFDGTLDLIRKILSIDEATRAIVQQ